MASVNRAKDLSAIALSSDPVWARTIPRRPVDQTLVSVGVAWRRASSQGPGNRPFAPPPATRRAGPEGPDSARFRRTRLSWRHSEHGAGRYHEQVRQATPRGRVVSSRSIDARSKRRPRTRRSERTAHGSPVGRRCGRGALLRVSTMTGPHCGFGGGGLGGPRRRGGRAGFGTGGAGAGEALTNPRRGIMWPETIAPRRRRGHGGR